MNISDFDNNVYINSHSNFNKTKREIIIELCNECDKCKTTIHHNHIRPRHSTLEQYTPIVCINGLMKCNYCDWTFKCNCPQ